ncbi:Acetyltransferase (isoleucine patch superfamily) [Beutenbergia cavernae DSM 12333]|uniref:Acetyltransferase (Isoleucine patch superfamily) n=1 Tax=Beutenbergia cavernae (strain ATCC BAA-8 / DSM 12333 / CCUG 43141 / JCM 11478 / NBRC 16432 / NCIMB 13614 / HKI 0122) TaxID=471853 RepID=C5C147_BEUC1|nr:Acetyltransferase (isoleucine patch superfamily) [Beutenbergia cavernae DSM 12333]
MRPWSDADGNVIEADEVPSGTKITFKGRNNRLVVAPSARLGRLEVVFDCDNGVVEVGPSSGVPALMATMRVGQDARVVIGANVSTTGTVAISAVEGVEVRIGDDVMMAEQVQIRADDGHPIFDVRTGRRVNPARSISIGAHVWLGFRSSMLGGATIGDGSVIGLGAVVKGRIPNNCIAAGVPARVVRRDVAWERPHLSLVKPYYKPDASTVTTSAYWAPTAQPDRPSARRRVRAWGGRVLRRLGLRR